MEDECKQRTPEFIDRVISCEIPNIYENPILHQEITANNIHGPCGATNMQCPCMEGVGQDCHCTKGYLKAFRNNTIAGDSSYPEYRCRSPENGGLIHNLQMKNNTQYNVDNKWVLPYNPFLSLKYSAHINVEIVNSVEAFKYLNKYITKGHDKVTFTVEGEEGQEQAVHDEIKTFLHAWCISASEAYWRIYQFPLQSRKLPVEKLPCHLPGDQVVLYQEGHEAETIQSGEPITKLTDFFELNKRDKLANGITYPDLPKYYTWSQTNKQWQRCLQGHRDEHKLLMTNSLGSIPTISLSPHQSELYHLRMLLRHKTGSTTYEQLRTIDDHKCPTFQAACLQMGLLDHYNERNWVMEEASSIRFGPQLREVFCTILLYCMPADPLPFWNMRKYKLAEDIMRSKQETTMSMQAMHEVLLQLQERIEFDGLDMNKNFGLPTPDPSIVHLTQVPSVLREEMNYNTAQLQQNLHSLLTTLNSEQQQVYETII